MILNITAIVIGYLLGSIPTAYIVAQLSKGVDIRSLGLGNVGAANVFREIGCWQGVLVWAIDVIKGSASILVAMLLDVPELWILGSGFAALVGHNFPIYIKFKDGKGAATFMGIFLVLAPETMALTFILMSIPFLIARRIIIAIYAIAPVFLILIWFFERSTVLLYYSLFLLVFIGIRSMPPPGKIWNKFTRQINQSNTNYNRNNK